MTFDRFMKRLLRKRLRNERLYNGVRRSLLLWQYMLRRPDEPDFKAFRKLCSDDRGLFIDVGANGGQSAVGFGTLFRHFRIESFEPNPALWGELDFVKTMLGHRFSYHRVGLGKERSTVVLHVPTFGNLPITTRASVCPSSAKRKLDALAEDLGERGQIQEVLVAIIPFDDLRLRPDVVKIDVEGHELAVLQGMSGTIAEARPSFLLERNPAILDCQALLKDAGYEILYYDKRTDALVTDGEESPRNWFAVPPERLAND